MSFFDVTKTANPTDNRQAVDTEGIALQSGSAASRDQAVTLGGIGTKNTLGADLSGSNAVQADNSTVLAGYGNQNQLGGLKLNDNKGTITVNSSEGVEAVSKTFADTVKEFLSGGKASPTEGKPLETKPTTPAETSGDVIKPVMWVLGILLTIVVGAWLASRRKKKSE